MPGGIPQTPFDVRRQEGERQRMLGYRQVQVTKFIFAYHAEHGRAPIYREIMDACGISTAGEVSRIISALEGRPLGIRRRKREKLAVPDASKHHDGFGYVIQVDATANRFRDAR
jgi:SOS-response transcriptional repressor LexA